MNNSLNPLDRNYLHYQLMSITFNQLIIHSITLNRIIIHFITLNHIIIHYFKFQEHC